MRFYHDAETLGLYVSRFLVEGWASDQPAVVIARREHRTSILDALSRGLDVHALQESGALSVLDAESLLAGFMIGSTPSAALFQRNIVPMMETLGIKGQRTIRAYGEMVDILWQRGDWAAALQVEEFWNDVSRTHPCATLCGYAADAVNRLEGAADAITRLHSHVSV